MARGRHKSKPEPAPSVKRPQKPKLRGLRCHICKDGTPATCRIKLWDDEDNVKGYCDGCARIYISTILDSGYSFTPVVLPLSAEERIPDPSPEIDTEAVKTLGGPHGTSPMLQAVLKTTAPKKTLPPQVKPIQVSAPTSVKSPDKADRPDPNGLLSLLGL